MSERRRAGTQVALRPGSVPRGGVLTNRPQQVSEDIILAQAFVNLVRDRRLDRYRTIMPLVILQTFDQLSFFR